MQLIPELNYVQAGFSFCTLTIILCGSLLNTLEDRLPGFIRHSFRYGKFAVKDDKSPRLAPVRVPKSWFGHFYIYAAFLTASTLATSVYVLLLEHDVPHVVFRMLDLACTRYRHATVDSAAVLLAVGLLTIQCWKRCYETRWVSVFNTSGHINLEHYIIGYAHYTGAVVAILAEAPKFAQHGAQGKCVLSNLTYLDLGAAVFFLWACWHQYKAATILANLRKNKQGDIVTEKHKLPHGDWFDYVSCPHMLAEILMYTALTVILRNNDTWFYVYTWVVVNQVETSLLNHWWYQENFDDLPKSRKAIIPFIY